MIDELLSRLQTPEPVLLNLTDLPRGVDNYHIDVSLSPRFRADFEKLLTAYIKHESSLVEGGQRESTEVASRAFQNSYLDMMTVLMHRLKTNLNPTEVNVLQFAVFRYVLERVQVSMDRLIDDLRSQLSELRARNSPKSLIVQEQIFWLSKHYHTKIFNINRRFFSLMQQVELRGLQSVRRQYLNPGDVGFLDILFNPMLCTAQLDAPNFLVGHYLMWSRRGEASDFSSLNAQVEALFSETLPQAAISPLVDAEAGKDQVEIHDDLRGFAACQNHLGAAPNQRNFISEHFSWIDCAANFTALFDMGRHRELARRVRSLSGFGAWWSNREELDAPHDILKRLRRILRSRQLLRQLAASNTARSVWRQAMSEQLDVTQLCSYLAGGISWKDFTTRHKATQVFSPAELKTLKDSVVSKQAAEQDSVLLAFLTAWANYRLHLKYYRFAHRVFNRLNILLDEDKLQLSSQAGTLYQLPTADEVKDDEVRTVHHAILKADVRGSTRVTEELERQGLNPASYFSLRFFSPINKVLPVYGAQKVFIEGDAIILAMLEHATAPQQWFAVARACGVAKAILAVVSTSNQHARQIGLPPLELGMGICYADQSPRYLYDGERPIMISSAIGQADRLSSCNWALREVIRRHPFNVEVLELATQEVHFVEKGRQQLLYNVNGIMLDNAAFAKLSSEIELSSASLCIDARDVLFHYGEYPDTQGKMRNLVIREGRVGLWREGRMEPGAGDKPFFEVVTNHQVISVLQERFFARKAAERKSAAGPVD